MKRIIFAFILSLLVHVVAFAAIATVQLLTPPPKKVVKIMYIKPVELPKTPIKNEPPKKAEVKQPPKSAPQVPEPPKTPEKIAVNPIPTPTPYSLATPKPIQTPPVIKKPDQIVFEPPKPVKTPVPKKLTPQEIKIQQEKRKVAILKKHPYFKNWPESRIKKLELPPGMTSWEEAEKLTEYLDNQYKWTYTPPALGNGENAESKNPDVNPYESSNPATPEATPSPADEITPEWKEYKEANKDYSIRFYKDNVGFIAYFRDGENKVTISYFPFTTTETDKDKIEVKIPENLNPEDIKSFPLPLTKEDLESRKNPEQDKTSKDQLVRDIIRTYNQQKVNP